MPVLLFEGVSLSGKSTLIKALSRQQRVTDLRTKLFVGEEYTERFFEEPEPKADWTERLAGLDRLLQMAEQLMALHKTLGEISGRSWRRPLVVFERFHITHAAYKRKTVQPLADLDSRLAVLGAQVIMPLISEQEIRGRIARSVQERGDGWRRFIDRFPDQDAAVDHFLREQEAFRRAAASSALPAYHPDPGETNVDAVAKDIVRRFIRDIRH